MISQELLKERQRCVEDFFMKITEKHRVTTELYKEKRTIILDFKKSFIIVTLRLDGTVKIELEDKGSNVYFYGLNGTLLELELLLKSLLNALFFYRFNELIQILSEKSNQSILEFLNKVDEPIFL